MNQEGKGFGRHYPKGRMNAEDDGACAFGVASDLQAKRVVIKFDRPMVWLGLDLETAMGLLQLLATHIARTFGVVVKVQVEDTTEQAGEHE